MAGKTEYFGLCFLCYIFITCAVLVKSNFFTDKRLIKLPLGEAEIEPPSTSMFSGLNPFACRTLFCQSTRQVFFHPHAHGKETFWTLYRNRAHHHSLVHTMMAGHLLKGKRTEQHSQFHCKDSRICSNLAQLLLKSKRMNS